MQEMKEICRQLQTLGRYMIDHQLTWGNAGNISCRVSADRYLITATGTSLGELTEDDLVMVGLHDDKMCSGVKKPSKETPMHQAVYEERADIGAVIHASPFYSTLWASTNLEIPSETFVESMYYLERVERVSYYHPGSCALGAAVREKCAAANILFLENHGVLVYDVNIGEARMALYALELSCRMWITAMSAGLKISRLSPDTVADFLNNSGYRPRRKWLK